MAEGWRADVLVVGGGMGGVAAVQAACAAGADVVLTEEYPWLGGQLTSQGVPPDEHPWIETHGSTASYRALRRLIRSLYRATYPLSESASGERRLNPGRAWVSELSVEPRVAALAVEAVLQPWIAAGRLRVLRRAVPVSVATDGDVITGVSLRDHTGRTVDVEPRYVLDATETGDLLALGDVEHRTGSESRDETGEPHAGPGPRPLNMQAVTHCFAVDHVDGDHVIDRPPGYDRWRDFRPEGWPGPMFAWTYPSPRTGEPVTAQFAPNAPAAAVGMEEGVRAPELWSYRRVLARETVRDDVAASDVTIVNWPMNDYLAGPVFGVPDAAQHRAGARELSRCLLYWLQTEAPRPDGGTGWPGLRLRPDVMGTDDGLAQAPYIRESRRIVAVTTPVEQDLSVTVRAGSPAVRYPDTVGTGAYRIDLHPTAGGDGYLDIAALPFTIPLGALVPVRVRNLVAAGKTIGSTHITNGCYRVHPAEWSIGEAAGMLAAYALESGVPPHGIQASAHHIAGLQARLVAGGADLDWHGDERLPG